MMTYGFARRVGVTVVATMSFAAATWVVGSAAKAAGPATIPMGTAANYAVLGATTVTNTGPSIIDGNVGLAPGPSITGFPPGVVTPPAMWGPENDANAQQAQADLAAAYTAAVNRPVDSIQASDLGTAPTLPAGVYSADMLGALTLTGTLVLDGQNDPGSVFIFKTGTTLTTASDSVVSLINGAQECNVFWQIGTSATLGTRTNFSGNILAATSITATTGVTVHGRALARDAAVTLDTNRFTAPTCTLDAPTTTSVPATSVPAVTTTLPETTTTEPITTTVPTATTTLPETTTVPATTTSTTSDPTTTTSSSAPVTTPATGPTSSTTDPGAVSTTTAASTSPGTARRAPPATTVPALSASAEAAALALTGSDRRAPLLGAVTIALGLLLTVVSSRRARANRDDLTKR